jgi:quinol monooxygenase YgiN
VLFTDITFFKSGNTDNEVNKDSMMTATMRMTVKPERRNDFLESIKGMLEPTRVKRGSISYRLYEDIEDRNTFALIEEWKTREDFENHVRTDTYRQLLALMELLGESLGFQFSTVAKTEGMELLTSVLTLKQNGKVYKL